MSPIFEPSICANFFALLTTPLGNLCIREIRVLSTGISNLNAFSYKGAAFLLLAFLKAANSLKNFPLFPKASYKSSFKRANRPLFRFLKNSLIFAVLAPCPHILTAFNNCLVFSPTSANETNFPDSFKTHLTASSKFNPSATIFSFIILRACFNPASVGFLAILYKLFPTLIVPFPIA